jgi:hypothetical protein
VSANCLKTIRLPWQKQEAREVNMNAYSAPSETSSI